MGNAIEADVKIDSPDKGDSLMVSPLTTKGEMVFSRNEWADPHDMSDQDIMKVIEYFTQERECVIQMTENGLHMGYVLP